MNKIYIFLLVFALFSCAKKVVLVAEKKQEKVVDYQEDLSEFRFLLDPEKEILVTENTTLQEAKITSEPMYINDKIDALLAKRTEKNKGIKYANGFRIQLYVGRDRKTADDAKIFIYQNYPTINPYLTYSLPIYKLKVGDFITRPDAERVLNQLKDQYPEAMILSEKIDVKKSFLKE